jgi:hypothetical protein
MADVSTASKARLARSVREFDYHSRFQPNRISDAASWEYSTVQCSASLADGFYPEYQSS